MIGVLVSGTGTNLQALLDADLPVVAVASNRAEAPALARAGEIPTAAFELGDYASRSERDATMAELDEVPHALTRAAHIVQQNRIGLDFRYGTVEKYDRHTRRNRAANMGRIGAGSRSEQNPVGAIGTQGAQQSAFPPDLLVCIGGYKKVVTLECGVLCSANNSGEEGIRDVRKDHSQHLGLFDFESAGNRIRRIIEFLDRSKDAFT